MRGLVMIPFIVMAMGFITELNSLAKESSDKAIVFATDMSNAIDCAAEARPLNECSPGLISHNFNTELAKLNKISTVMRDKLGNRINRTIERS